MAASSYSIQFNNHWGPTTKVSEIPRYTFFTGTVKGNGGSFRGLFYKGFSSVMYFGPTDPPQSWASPSGLEVAHYRKATVDLVVKD